LKIGQHLAKLEAKVELFHFFQTRYISTITITNVLFMVALWNRADHYIFALWFLCFFFFLLA